MIICTEFSSGKCHDFKLFIDSGVHLRRNTVAVVDMGYLGIQLFSSSSFVPKKKSKNNPLTKQDKQWNRELARDRVLNEHVIGQVKKFKIVSDRYRNRRKRFNLRFNLIAGIYNVEL